MSDLYSQGAMGAADLNPIYYSHQPQHPLPHSFSSQIPVSHQGSVSPVRSVVIVAPNDPSPPLPPHPLDQQQQQQSEKAAGEELQATTAFSFYG